MKREGGGKREKEREINRIKKGMEQWKIGAKKREIRKEKRIYKGGKRENGVRENRG